MNNRNNKLISLVISALLIAIAIIIPMFAPKIILEPASFTLASHVPVFIAMFISPPVAIAVALGSTIGFLFAGFPIVVVLRALSHVVFATIGAFLLMKKPDMLLSIRSCTLFGLLMAVIHAVCEVTVVTLFYFGGGMGAKNYASGYFTAVILLVGVGTIVHSMIDFGIAVFIWKPVSRVVQFPVSAKAR